MKKSILMVVLVAIVTFFSGKAFAGVQDFTLVNNTGHTICSIYVSDSGTEVWEVDILGGKVLKPGQSIFITINGRTELYRDIKVVYSDSKPDTVWTKINLKKMYKAVVTDNASGGSHMD